MDKNLLGHFPNYYVEWNYSPTSHGKVEFNKLGGSIKRMATKASKICQATINDNETLFEALSIDFVFLTEEEIKSVLETTHTKMD